MISAAIFELSTLMSKATGALAPTLMPTMTVDQASSKAFSDSLLVAAKMSADDNEKPTHAKKALIEEVKAKAIADQGVRTASVPQQNVLFPQLPPLEKALQELMLSPKRTGSDISAAKTAGESSGVTEEPKKDDKAEKSLAEAGSKQSGMARSNENQSDQTAGKTTAFQNMKSLSSAADEGDEDQATPVAEMPSKSSEPMAAPAAASILKELSTKTASESAPSHVKALQDAIATAGVDIPASLVAKATASAAPKTDATVSRIATHVAAPSTATSPTTNQAPAPVSAAPLKLEPSIVHHTTVKAPAKDDAAETSTSNLQEQPSTSSANGEQPAHATAARINDLISKQSAVLNPASVTASAASQSAMLNSKPSPSAKVASVDAINGATGSKEVSKAQAESASTQVASPASAQGSTTAGGQGQNGATPQGQSEGQEQANFASHVAAASIHSPSASPETAGPSSTTGTAGSGQSAKDAEVAGQTPAAVAQAVPVINTAKLIQSMGQTEMRVGMHSNEFGNVSITTSSSKDVISAQISLEHGELAKTLAAHLPEMQAKLVGGQALEVRIDMNGQSTAQSTSKSNGMSEGSSGESRGESRTATEQAHRASASSAGSGFSVRPALSSMAAMNSNGGAGSARLDIRI